MKSPNMLKSPIYTKSTREPPNGRMEAIACGVQVRLEERTGYSRRVTDETVSIARALGLGDREISSWVNQRLRQLALNEARLRGIKDILDRIRSDIQGMS
jgi:adenylosuccinate lyase